MSYCSQCGGQMRKEDSYCGSCGALATGASPARVSRQADVFTVKRAISFVDGVRRRNPAVFYAFVAVVALGSMMAIGSRTGGAERVDMNAMRLRVPSEWSVSGSNHTVSSTDMSPEQAMSDAADAFSDLMLDRENGVDFCPSVYNEDDGTPPVGGFVSLQPSDESLSEQVDSFNRGIYDGVADEQNFTAGSLKGYVLEGYDTDSESKTLTYVLTEGGDEEAGWYVFGQYWAEDEETFGRYEKDCESIIKSLRVDYPGDQ